jgi:hypothetical protein
MARHRLQNWVKMEVDDAAVVEELLVEVLKAEHALGLLSLVKSEQASNGIKHGDYERYRCALGHSWGCCCFSGRGLLTRRLPRAQKALREHARGLAKAAQVPARSYEVRQAENRAGAGRW